MNKHPTHHNRRYILDGEINAGSFGTVYKAHAEALDKANDHQRKIVAVKIVDVHDNYEKENALYEAQIQRQLRSVPNIVHLFDFFVCGCKAYYVQELARGGDVLSRLLEKDRYQEKEAKKLARNLITTIRTLHSKEIVHRDLKPENLLLKEEDNDTKIMLCDFGDAYRFTDEDVEDDKLYTICGTPAFMAPEIKQGGGYRGKEVDMWSIGCILYLLVGGYAPFGYDDDLAFERSSKADYNFDCKPWTTEVSSSAMNLISKLLTIDPGDRLTASDALNSRWLSPSSSRKKTSSSSLFINIPASLNCKMLIKQLSRRALMQHWKHASVASNIGLKNRRKV